MIKKFVQLLGATCLGMFVCFSASTAFGQTNFDPAASLPWRHLHTTEETSVYIYSPASTVSANARFVNVWRLVFGGRDRAIYGISEEEIDCSTSRSRTTRRFGSAIYMGTREYPEENVRSPWETAPAGSLQSTWIQRVCSNQVVGNELGRPFTAREIATRYRSGEIVGRPISLDCNLSAEQSGLSSDLLRQNSEQLVGEMLASDVLRTVAPNGERPRLVISAETMPDSVRYFVRNALVEAGTVRVFAATAQNIADPGVLVLLPSCSRETAGRSSFIIELMLATNAVPEGRVLGRWLRRVDR